MTVAVPSDMEAPAAAFRGMVAEFSWQDLTGAERKLSATWHSPQQAEVHTRPYGSGTVHWPLRDATCRSPAPAGRALSGTTPILVVVEGAQNGVCSRDIDIGLRAPKAAVSLAVRGAPAHMADTAAGPCAWPLPQQLPQVAC